MLEVRGARPQEVDAAIECCGAAFGNGDPARSRRMAEFFARIHKGDPNFRPENTRVAVLDGRIVSVVQVFDRTIRIGPARVRLGGIGSVGTHPRFRGRGLNTRVLEDAVQYMEQEGYDLSLLFTGIPEYYGRLGWQEFPHADYLHFTVGDPVEPIPFSGRLRPVDWDSEIEQLARIHDLADAEAAGPVVRTVALWRAHRYWRRFDVGQIVVAETSEGAIVAYRRRGDPETLVEVQALPGWEEAAVALVLDFYNDLARREITTMRLFGNPPWVNALAALGLTFQRRGRGGIMYRIIRLQSLVKKIVSAEENGLPPERTLRIGLTTDVGSVTMIGDGNRFQLVSDDEPLDWELRLSHAQAIDLFLGQLGSVELASVLKPYRVDRAAALAWSRAMFPQRPYRWYVEDSF